MDDENDKEVEGERENKRHTQWHDARTNRKKQQQQRHHQ